MDRSPLVFILPAAAVVLVTTVLFGPGQERPAIGGRILLAGEAAEGLRSLRLETVERGAPIQQHVEVSDLVLEGPGGTSLWTGTSGRFGVVDVALPSPLPNGSHVILRKRGGRVLAEGALETRPAPPPSISAAKLEGVTEGALTVSAEIPGGALIPSIRAPVLLRVRDAAGPVDEAKLTVKTSSVEPEEATIELKDGSATLDVVVIASPAVLEITAATASTTGKLRVELPAVMGAIAATTSGGRLDLVSPSPREVAFVSLFDRTGRTGGAVVPLEAAPDGYFRGSVDAGDFFVATVSSDPHETSAATVSWPGAAPGGLASAPKVTLALDGLPQAVQAERARVARVRTVTTAALSLAAALEIAILLWTRRQSRTALARTEAAMAEGEDENAPVDSLDSRGTARSTSAFVAAMVGLVLLAFAAVLGLVVLR